MKKITFLFLFLISISNAQSIVFTDSNFKAILLAANAQTNSNIAKDLAGNPATIDTNGDNEIQVSEALQISSISTAYGAENTIQSFQGLEFFTNLREFQSIQSQITSINLTNNVNLTKLDVRSNNLTTLNLETNVNLKYLYIRDTQIATIVYNNLDQLEEIDLTNLPISSLAFSNFPQLRKVDCFNTNFSNLDFGNNPFFSALTCGSSSLTYVNIKNGWPNSQQSIQIFNSPNLTYLCCDDNEMTQLVLTYASLLPNCNIGSYCSFNPGGTFYTLTGTNKIDSNLNGCDANDIVIPNLKFDVFSSSTSGSFYCNATGGYSIPFQEGNYFVYPKLENPSYFAVLPTSINAQFPLETSPYNQNFCITPNGIQYDLEVAFTRLDAQIPGLDVSYKIIFKNKGNQIQSGTISLNFDDAIMDFVSSNPVQSQLIANQLTWNYSNLIPFETREIVFIMNLNSPMDTPPLNAGNRIAFSGSIQPNSAGIVDDYPDDNTINVDFSVVNSADPNDITCLEGNSVGPNQIGKYVHYLVRFENVGTANAMNVVLKNTIDATKFDIETLITLSSNYDFVTRKNGNKFEFIFENINLPFDDENNDGYLVYKIKLKNDLTIGTTFTNQVNIYFDFNFPILTNLESTTIQALNVNDVESNKISIHPNPTKGLLNVYSENLTNFKTEVFDLVGKKVASFNNQSQIDVSNLTSGVYLVKITNNLSKETITKKIVKQ